MRKEQRTHYSDEFYMHKALQQAKVALKHKEVPIGAVVVDNDGKILSRSYNKVERTGCQTGHAEVIAIKNACKKRGDWRLNGCSLYVTLEPCLMCMGLIQLSRIERIVFGAKSPLFGCGILSEKSRLLTKSYAQKLKVVDGICLEECTKLLRGFFCDQRKKKGE